MFHTLVQAAGNCYLSQSGCLLNTNGIGYPQKIPLSSPIWNASGSEHTQPPLDLASSEDSSMQSERDAAIPKRLLGSERQKASVASSRGLHKVKHFSL